MRLRPFFTACILIAVLVASIAAVGTRSAPAAPVPAPALQLTSTEVGPSSIAWPEHEVGLAAYVQAANAAHWYETAAEKDRQAAAAAARAAAAPRHSRPSLPSGSGDCANPVVSTAVAMRESGCRWDAYNASGCSGRGCIGFYQEDAGHYYAHSPWNPSQPGACYGLDSSTQAGQTECAQRLGPNAWG